jgi:hypothetical protein
MTGTPGSTEPKAVYRQISGLKESQEAIGEVIREAGKTLRIFDYTLENRGFSSPARIEAIRHFLLAGRAHRLMIALHEPEQLERNAPRLVMLLRDFSHAVAIHRTTGQARGATDPFVLADDHSVWHQMHHDHPRAIVALHSPENAIPLEKRFAEIWELSEPAVSAFTTGL